MHPRIAEIMDHLDDQRTLLRRAFDEGPVESREREPAPGRWSVAGIIEHLAIVEERVAGALAARIASARADGVAVETSTDPVLPSFDLARIVNRTKRFNAPDAIHPTGLTALAAWDALERAGGRIRAVLRAGDGLALDTVTHEHPAFGPISIYEWFAVVGSHEARHAGQILEINASARSLR
jgi:hypothetical protein